MARPLSSTSGGNVAAATPVLLSKAAAPAQSNVDGATALHRELAVAAMLASRGGRLAELHVTHADWSGADVRAAPDAWAHLASLGAHLRCDAHVCPVFAAFGQNVVWHRISQARGGGPHALRVRSSPSERVRSGTRDGDTQAGSHLIPLQHPAF